MYINYYAPDSKLYPKTEVTLSSFRAWALSDLEAYYSSHTIQVLSSESDSQVITDDTSNISDIQVYCSKLWLRWYNTQG